MQTDGTAQCPRRPCSHAEIAMTKYDSLVNKFYLTYNVWKRFRDNIFVLWEHGAAFFSFFLDYLNLGKTGKIKFTIETTSDTGLLFFDLKLKINEGKIMVNVYDRSTNSFSYNT